MKTLGVILLFFSCVIFGGYSSYKAKASLCQLRSLIDLMRYIRNQIEYFNTPISDIYSSYHEDNENMRCLINEISCSGWGKALKDCQHIYLSHELTSYLTQFGELLGKSGKDEQLSHCDYYLKILEDEYAKKEKDTPKKAKVSLALGFCAGLMLLILFI